MWTVAGQMRDNLPGESVLQVGADFELAVVRVADTNSQLALFAVLFTLVLDFLSWYRVPLRCPSTQINQLAPFTTERTPGRVFGPFDRTIAGGTRDGRHGTN